MTGTLIGVGVGPGDPDLLTLKAVRVLETASVVVYPANPRGESRARATAAAHIPLGAEEIPLVMDFAPDRAEARKAYETGATVIAERLRAGRDVAVLCEGDALFYGSFTYLLDRLGDSFPVRVVPGVSSLTAGAAAAVHTLVQGDEPLVCAPATLPEERLEAVLRLAVGCVLFKVGRHLDKASRVLERVGLAEQAVVVIEAASPAERVLPLSDARAAGVPYFSLILARRPAAP